MPVELQPLVMPDGSKREDVWNRAGCVFV